MESSIGVQPTSNARSAPSFSMSGRVPVVGDPMNSSAAKAQPGPGAYHSKFATSVGKQVSATKRTMPAASFGSGPQRVDHGRVYKDLPGPGEYSPPPGGQHVGSFKATIRSRTFVKPLHKTPGPADYTIAAGIGKQPVSTRASAPAYSMASRRTKGGIGEPTISPGPMAYNTTPKNPTRHPLSTVYSAPAFAMASRPKKVVHHWDAQGPGQCRTDSGFGKQVSGGQRSNPSLSFGQRTGASSVYPKNTNPGPGSYDPSRALRASSRVKSTPAFSLTSRVKRPPRAKTPGPGDYREPGGQGKQVSSTRRSAAAYGFGTDTSRKKGVAKRDGVPGPGEYQPVGDIGSPQAKKKGASMRGREKFGSLVSFDPAIPGPAAYDDQSNKARRRAPTPVFSTSRRNTGLEKAGPGPAAYSPKIQKKTPEFSLGTRKFAPYKSADAVGPGVCREDTAFGKRAGGFTFGHRTPIKVDDPSPGPGAYGRFSRGVRGVKHKKLNLKGKPRRKRRVQSAPPRRRR